MSFRVVAKAATHNDAVAALWTEHFGGTTVVSRGRVHDARALSGFVAVDGESLVGALTWRHDGDAFEVVSLDSLRENGGIGTALLDAAVRQASALGARRIWLVTSNDNIRAIRFYQKRGWDMVAIHRDAVTGARKLKPQIPLTGEDGIAIRHEIEFELRLSGA